MVHGYCCSFSTRTRFIASCASIWNQSLLPYKNMFFLKKNPLSWCIHAELMFFFPSCRFFQGNNWGEIRQRPPEFIQEGVWTQWDEVSHFTVLLLYFRPDLFIVCLCRGDMMVPVALVQMQDRRRRSDSLCVWVCGHQHVSVSVSSFCSMSTSHSVVVTWFTFFF